MRRWLFRRGGRFSSCSRSSSRRCQIGRTRCLSSTRIISDRCAWFSDLLAAVFVACTKILSAVRLKADNKKISLKLPTNEVFIQTCYNNVAKDIYKDPYIFHDEQSEYIRDEKSDFRFCLCIESTVKELIPVQQILQTYMSQESRDISLDGDVDDSPDPDVIDDSIQ